MSTRARAWGPVDFAPLAAYGVLAVALFSGAWSDPSRTLVGVPADNVLVMWALRWEAHALAGGHGLLYTHAVGFPGGVNLLSTTPVILAGLVLSPLTWLAGPVVSYDVLATGALVLSGWCAYLCIRRYSIGRIGPALGGLVYGFSPPLLAQSYGHPQITTAFLVPLVVILVDEALVRRPSGTRRKPVPAVAVGGALGLVLVAQLLLSAEVLATEVMMALVLVVVLGLLHPGEVRLSVGRAVRVGATSAAVFAVLGAWPLYVELAGKGHTIGGPIRGLDTYVTNLANLIAPTVVQALGPFGVARHFPGGVVESDGYLGIPLLAVVGWALWRCRRVPAVAVAGLVGLVALVLSFGPRLEVGEHITAIPMPWALLDHLPVLRDVLPSRLAVYVDLAAALILAVWVGEVEARVRGSLRPKMTSARPGVLVVEGLQQPQPLTPPARSMPGGAPAALGLAAGRLAAGPGLAIALIVASLFPAVPFPSYHPPLPAFFDSARSSAAIPTGSVAVLLPLDSSSALYWQALAGMRFSMPESHFGTGPKPPSPLGPLSTALLGAQETGALPASSAYPGLRGRFAKACVTSVAAGPIPHEAAVVSLVSRVLGRSPRLIGGVELWSIGHDPGCSGRGNPVAVGPP